MHARGVRTTRDKKEIIMSTKALKKLNGMDLDRIFETLDAIKAQPEIADFQFRARNKWIDAGVNRSEIKDFYGACQEDTSRSEPFVFTCDEPPVLLGTDQGANPVEYLLHAMAGCITTTTVLHAAARGIKIHELSTELEGDIDLQAFLAIDESDPVGYKEVRIKVNIKADCSEEELDDLVKFAENHSPVCSTVCRPVPVVVERVKS
jgi:uncharacterized OsmC-like protein